MTRMDATKASTPVRSGRASVWRQLLIGTATFATAIGLFLFVPRHAGHEASANTRQVEDKNGDAARFYPTPAQWASLTVEPVATETFHEELITEGKIAVEEDHATAIYSPYTGRVTKLLVAPGDKVSSGQPLFVLEAADSVQIQNDFIAALSAYNKAALRST